MLICVKIIDCRLARPGAVATPANLRNLHQSPAPLNSFNPPPAPRFGRMPPTCVSVPLWLPPKLNKTAQKREGAKNRTLCINHLQQPKLNSRSLFEFSSEPQVHDHQPSLFSPAMEIKVRRCRIPPDAPSPGTNAWPDGALKPNQGRASLLLKPFQTKSNQKTCGPITHPLHASGITGHTPARRGPLAGRYLCCPQTDCTPRVSSPTIRACWPVCFRPPLMA
jgi:hypothetical protein